MNILFLCTGNSCRSIIAEALLKSVAPAGITVQSAGSKPAGYVHPRALSALQKAGISIDSFHSKSWDTLSSQPDIIITLCADAAGETCPAYLGTMAVRSHWGMPDPAKAQGGESAIEAAFDNTLAVLHKKINALVKLLEQQPRMKPELLQNALDAIDNQFK